MKKINVAKSGGIRALRGVMGIPAPKPRARGRPKGKDPPLGTDPDPEDYRPLAQALRDLRER